MKCSFETCDRPARRHCENLCFAHHKQLMKGVPLGPLPLPGEKLSKDHIGEIHNGRKVIERGPDIVVQRHRKWKRGKRKDHVVSDRTRTWLVECITCGRRITITWQQVRTRSCKKCKDMSHRKSDVHVVSMRMFESLSHGAKSRGHSCGITVEDYAKIMQEPCHYCGNEGGNLHSLYFRNFRYNGIDRVDNDVGYEIGNIVPCCFTCNRAKSAMKYDEFIAYLKRISTFWKEESYPIKMS